MTSFRLWFSGGTSPQLERTEFSHPLLKESRRAVRGKSSGAYLTEFTFQWTSAVKGISALAVRTVLSDSKSLGLIGEKGTLASSLDFAIGKQVQWLQDMFGGDSAGVSLIRRVIKRSNPEGRRPGPTVLSFNSQLLPFDRIFILIDGEIVTEKAALRQLLSAIAPGEADAHDASTEALWRGSERTPTATNRDRHQAAGASSATEGYPQPFNDPLFRSSFRGAIREEIACGLNSVNIFGNQAHRKHVESILKNPSFTVLAGRNAGIVSEIDLNLDSRSRLGICASSSSKSPFLLGLDRPLRIAVAADLVAPISLLLMLKHRRGYQIEIDYKYPTTIDILDAIRAGRFTEPPDGCLFVIATAAQLLGSTARKDYAPLMIMPGSTYRIISSVGSEKCGLDRGLYYLLSNRPSSAQFVFDDLVRRSLVRKSKIGIVHTELDESLDLFSEEIPEAKAILCFPHFFFNSTINGTRFVDSNSTDVRETALFLSTEYAKQPALQQELDTLLRSVWLDLRSDPGAIDWVAGVLADDPEYLKFCSRFSGLYAVQPESFQQNFEPGEQANGQSSDQAAHPPSAAKRSGKRPIKKHSAATASSPLLCPPG